MNEPTVKLTSEEANELDLLLRQELSNSHVELHHTISVNYRDRIKRHMEVLEGLLKKMDKSEPAK